MNYIDDLNTLQQFIRTQPEVIIFSIGREGRTFLDFLYYTNSSSNVCCITTNVEKRIQNRGGGVTFINSIPVIPLDCMVHCRDTAVFIISAPSSTHQDAHQLLVNFGCKKIVIIKEEVIAQLQNVIQNFASSGQLILQSINRIENKIIEMEYRIAEQNEISALHKNTFENYRNCFHGKKVVIVASGPTAKFYEPIHDAIHIGVNFSFRIEQVLLDYLFIHDGAAMETETKIEQGFSKIKDKIFIGKFLDRLENHWCGFPESYSLMMENIHRFYLGENSFNQPIYQDICHHPLIDFGSIAFPTFQFALFTYPSELYLVGCDTADTGHAYKESRTNFAGWFPMMKMKLGYARLKLFANKYYPDTKIISVNPVGLKGLFNDVYTNDFKRN